MKFREITLASIAPQTVNRHGTPARWGVIAQRANKSTATFPVGGNSQGNSNLFDYNVLITDDGQAIATINNYTDVTEFVKL